MKDTILQIKDVCKRFGAKEVLKGVNLDISKGEIFGLLGPSGAGKTTLVKILTGQLEYDSGEAKVLGCDCRNFNKDIYAQMGMVLDDSGLYPRLNCFDNLKIFASIRKVPVSKVYEVLKSVGLSEARKTATQDLSKGMRQRLILARAILHNPKVLFLDEPTSGLDPSTARQIHRLIMNLKEDGATILLTTHNMEEATELCSHVALLHEGSIVEYGEPLEICRKYNHERKITILQKSGKLIELASNKNSAEQIAKLFENDSVETIHSSEPNLAEVFLQLTGKGLEEE